MNILNKIKICAQQFFLIFGEIKKNSINTADTATLHILPHLALPPAISSIRSFA